MLLSVNQTPHYLPLADYFKFVFFLSFYRDGRSTIMTQFFTFLQTLLFLLSFHLLYCSILCFFPISVPVASLPFSLHLIALFGFLQLAYRFSSCNGIYLRVDTARMSMELTLRYGLRHVTAVFHHGLLQVTVLYFQW
jgi:hypothetical protein